MALRKYSIEDERTLYNLRRISGCSEAQASEETGTPMGTIGGLIHKYEGRLRREGVLQEIISHHGLTEGDLMSFLEPVFPDITPEQVENAVEDTMNLPPEHIHILLAEFDEDNLILNPDGVEEVEQDIESQLVAQIVDEHYDRIVVVLSEQISKIVDGELDHLVLPVELLTSHSQTVTLEDVLQRFGEIRIIVRDLIVAKYFK